MNYSLLTIANLVTKMRCHYTLMPLDLSASSWDVLEQSLTTKLSTKSDILVLQISMRAVLSQQHSPFGRMTMTTRTILMCRI
jgi:hypothetical protein